MSALEEAVIIIPSVVRASHDLNTKCHAAVEVCVYCVMTSRASRVYVFSRNRGSLVDVTSVTHSHTDGRTELTLKY